MGRLCVAGSKNRYLPKILGNEHCSTKDEDLLSTKKLSQHLPSPVIFGILWFARKTKALRWEKQVPVYETRRHQVPSGNVTNRLCRYPMVMNACITSFYIIIGTFDSLVTFIGRWSSQPSMMYQNNITKP